MCRQALQIQMPRYTASETQEYMPKRGHPTRRRRQRTVCPVSWNLTNAYIWYFVTKLCPQEVTLDNSTSGRNRIVLPATALLVLLMYEIRLPHVISTKFPPRKMELFIQIGGLQWWKPTKNTSGETFRLKKKTRFLKRYSLTTSIATLAWGTYLLGFLPAWLNQQPHVYTYSNIIYHSLTHYPSCRRDTVSPVTTNLYFMFMVFAYRTHITSAKPSIVYVRAILTIQTDIKQDHGYCHLPPEHTDMLNRNTLRIYLRRLNTFTTVNNAHSYRK